MPEIHIFLKHFLTMAKAVHEIWANGEKQLHTLPHQRVRGSFTHLPTACRG